ncbi:hypothetical protein [uncultured Vibrio sp.]|uniref:hypothetical protein n=1 Tax=uncultured Vibrio sp. TaxID=114054 RepID=UPI002AAAA140|nr:hypothetical protein [uncultured Vibrio sp.]
MSKYQNGLGKEVFRRLLGMEISYFDKHSVGDLTKLFAGIVRNMTNPFFTQWVDVLERSSTLFESILIVRHTPAITRLECSPEIGHRE